MQTHFAFWAKLGDNEWPNEYHPVICHLIDVGRVAQALWQSAIRDKVRKQVAEQLGLSCDETARWLGFWIGAHDIGKVTPCFQHRDKKQDELKKVLESAGFTFNSDNVHHSRTGTKIFAEEFEKEGCGWPKLDSALARKIAVTVGGHHGTFPQSHEWAIHGPLGDSNWATSRRGILTNLARLFGVDNKTSVPKLTEESDQSIWMYLAGLTSVADWIGSNVDFFQARGNLDVARCGLNIDDYFCESGRRANEALKRLGWLDCAEPTGEVVSFEKATGIKNPRPLQEEIIKIANGLDKPKLIIVEAPMGEGKTEAAWYVADCWDHLGGQGTYVALPTMATSNQMFGRVGAFLEMSEGKKNLMLQHGKAALNKQFEKLKYAAWMYDEEKNPSSVVAEGWFAANKKHGLLAPFGVGTIDQALLAVLQTKHVFVRLFGLAGKCIILDEVHAYDAYMTTLMERLLTWLAALRCPVVLLSATLPESKRLSLLKAYAGSEMPKPKSENYPRMTTVAVGGEPVVTPIVGPAREKTVQLGWVAEENLVEKLKIALSDGGCAAVIRNTVGLAQDTYTRLKAELQDSGIKIDLFHARFPFGVRDKIEKRVLKRFGKEGGPRKRNKQILVATQVIEQSLDLDFDVMVSDVAPVDLVLQRAGRLHRHARGERPKGVNVPWLWLIEPKEEDGVPKFGKSEYVYSRHILFRSLLALKDKSAQIELPTHIDDLVRNVYSQEQPPAIFTEQQLSYWNKTKEEFEKMQHEECDEAEKRRIKKPSFSGALARIVSEPLDEDSPELHPAHQALTRLSGPTVQLVCLLADSDGKLRLPHDDSRVSNLNVRRIADGGIDDIRRFIMAELTVADMRVVRELWDAPRIPEEWLEVGMLRNHHLVLFENGVATFGKIELCLDTHLGLQIVRSESEGDE